MRRYGSSRDTTRSIACSDGSSGISTGDVFHALLTPSLRPVAAAGLPRFDGQVPGHGRLPEPLCAGVGADYAKGASTQAAAVLCVLRVFARFLANLAYRPPVDEDVGPPRVQPCGPADAMSWKPAWPGDRVSE